MSAGPRSRAALGMKPLVICLLSLLAGGAVTGVYTGVGRSDADQDARIADELGAVRAALGSLESAMTGNRVEVERFDARLDALEESIVALSSESGTEVLPGPTMDEVLAAVGELRHQVEAQFAETRTAIADATRGLRRQKAETDWDAIGEFLARWEADEDAATREIRRLSSENLLERYGPPSDIWHRDKGLTWVYTKGLDPETEKFELRLFLNLVGGYVAGVYVER